MDATRSKRSAHQHRFGRAVETPGHSRLPHGIGHQRAGTESRRDPTRDTNRPNCGLLAVPGPAHRHTFHCGNPKTRAAPGAGSQGKAFTM